MSGAMLGLRVPINIANAIKIDGGEPAELMHITLAYFKDAAADRDDWDTVKQIASKYTQFNGLQGSITGYGTFDNEEVVLWAQPEVPGLEELRERLVKDCNDAGFPVDDKFPDFKPHITLAYDWEGDVPELEQPIPVTFDGLYFYQGEKMQKVASSNVVRFGDDDPSGPNPKIGFERGARAFAYDPDTDTIYTHTGHHPDIVRKLYTQGDDEWMTEELKQAAQDYY